MKGLLSQIFLIFQDYRCWRLLDGGFQKCKLHHAIIDTFQRKIKDAPYAAGVPKWMQCFAKLSGILHFLLQPASAIRRAKALIPRALMIARNQLHLMAKRSCIHPAQAGTPLIDPESLWLRLCPLSDLTSYTT
jgi:hypothetical protein